MNYENETVMGAFHIYTALSRTGMVEQEGHKQYMSDDLIRGLVDQFASAVDCTIVSVGDQLHLIPRVRFSPFHISNESMKKNYLRSQAVNADLYLMYVAIIAFIGSFYDSYQSLEPTRDFIVTDEWIRLVQERIDTLKEHDPEQLKQYEKQFSYNWGAIVEKWDAMDDLKETAKRQSGNTISRLSFIDSVRRFMLDQNLAEQVGEAETALTEKTKIIVQRFFMELDTNRGILQFLYQLETDKKDAEHATEVSHDAVDL